VLPHLDAAFNLARWLTGNEHDAADVTQDAMVRAFKFFGSFRGVNSRPWLLTIVRNTFYTWRRERNTAQDEPLDERAEEIHESGLDPSASLLRSSNIARVRSAIEQLPTEWREVLVLRELEGLSYKEIADVADIPIGTVMSRLARARKQLQEQLSKCFEAEAEHEL